MHTLTAQRWQRLGSLYQTDCYASTPFACVQDGKLDILFTRRDANQRGYICSHTDVLLEPGECGTFDDSGCSLACIVEDKLYYVGWNLGVTVPFRNSIGLAIRKGDGYERYSQAPILDRHAVDPFHLSYPWVIKDGHRYRMWYGSNLCWGAETSSMRHVIKYAESDDGISWERNGHTCIDLEHPGEIAIARPCVLKQEVYRMWYAYKGVDWNYRLGYAESLDGYHWERKDQLLKLDGPVEAWESEIQCYPHVFPYQDRLHMLYCGNGYGKTGYGWAVAN